MKKENLVLLYVFVMVIFCTNPANALIVNFDVSGYAVYGSDNTTFSGTAILDVDDTPIVRVYDPSTDHMYTNIYELFHSFTVNLLGDNGETYNGSINYNDVAWGGDYGCPMDTYLTLNNFGKFDMLGLGANKWFQVGELLSEAFLPTWGFNAGGSDGTKQIYIALNFTESPAPVPEPATMFLLGSGLLGIAGFRKKLTRKV